MLGSLSVVALLLLLLLGEICAAAVVAFLLFGKVSTKAVSGLRLLMLKLAMLLDLLLQPTDLLRLRQVMEGVGQAEGCGRF